ncbi:hypothetical protein PICMEDRAFT_122888 [Pichia membranifaciens NRRL Y-2026]|uniref:Uncharacterized protein n=1 Tax=Pichia membranifaciens NRRL Y-2026 TaxID=763406 RepID=A0A1E3NQT9_9ASCO|nr:hypothetical protein PICMEDRAFT_122888 [Pichia membranifaciens NRRL Y-2026]ODQ48068.1 hypothetical protein PICMEDRAFT_122888 [Pichia membranifaciens NRRL Y-2026]
MALFIYIRGRNLGHLQKLDVLDAESRTTRDFWFREPASHYGGGRACQGAVVARECSFAALEAATHRAFSPVTIISRTALRQPENGYRR